MAEKNIPDPISEAIDVLIIEDNLELIDILEKELSRHHYCVRIAADGETGLHEAQRQPPEVIILDLKLPGISGLEVCQLLRKNPRTKAVPLLILTALGEEAYRIRGLEAGADDYLTKPFSLRELIARIKALIRRKRMATEPKPADAYRIGPLVLDTERHEIRMEGKLLRLTRTEFGILSFLMKNPERVFRRDELLTALWGENRFVEEHNLDVHIHAIRQQLEPDPSRPRFLVTIRGIGYKLNWTEEKAG